MKNNLIVCILVLLSVNLFSQEEDSKKLVGKIKDYSSLWAGVETSTTTYINTNTKDSNSVSLFIAPYVDYYHKSGFGLRVKTYALTAPVNSGIYLTSTSLYFAKYTGKVLPFISYTRYIENSNASIPYSPIQNEVYGHLHFKNKYVDSWAGVDIGFGNDEQNNNASVNDINAFTAISHLFLKDYLGPKKKNAIGFIPSIQLNAGTDKYFKFLRTSGYISQNTKVKRIGYGTRGRNPGQGGNNTTDSIYTYTINETNTFNLSNVEVNLHVLFFLNNFSIEPSGSMYFPLRGEDRTPYGYWQINLNYWF